MLSYRIAARLARVGVVALLIATFATPGPTVAAKPASAHRGLSGDPWGDDWFGQIGDGTTTFSGQPVRAVGLSNVIAISLGLYHTLALRSDGTVWASGDNQEGQLGDGTVADSAT